MRLLGLLWDRYAAEVPYARTFVKLSGGIFRDDHIALRTLARPGGGIATFERVFERFGWKRAGEYTFPDTHLAAIYMAHPNGLPRVFISELRPSGSRRARSSCSATLPGIRQRPSPSRPWPIGSPRRLRRRSPRCWSWRRSPSTARGCWPSGAR